MEKELLSFLELGKRLSEKVVSESLTEENITAFTLDDVRNLVPGSSTLPITDDGLGNLKRRVKKHLRNAQRENMVDSLITVLIKTYPKLEVEHSEWDKGYPRLIVWPHGKPPEL